MTSFNLGALRQWHRHAIGELLDFPAPRNGARSVMFDVIADSHVSIHAVYEDDAYLVAAGSGQMVVKFSIDESVGVTFRGDPDAEIFIRTHVDPQVIDPSIDPSYTNIEPRPAGPNDELRRMMHLMQLNTERREAAYRAEMEARLIAAQAAAVAPPAPAPVAPPALSDDAVVE